MPTIEQLQKFLVREPDDVFLNFGLAMELAKAGRTDDSVAQFDRVISLHDGYCPAYFMKGQTLLKAGRLNDAKAALQAGIETARRVGDDHAAAEMTELLESI
ncbi:MAG: hypothetical protein HUU22_04330 [Phycisphaerae bacterium]|nr:hypothetical protein [Phycisphaerae bacterium]NUQ45244.1 hypothetical protein [Phycisphaerae bacterium]